MVVICCGVGGSEAAAGNTIESPFKFLILHVPPLEPHYMITIIFPGLALWGLSL